MIDYRKTVDEPAGVKTPRLEVRHVVYQCTDPDTAAPRIDHKIVRSAPSVAVIIVKDDKIAFVRQFRSTTGNFYMEIPAGLLNANESEVEAANREAREESGIICRDTQVIVKGPALLDPSKSDENYGVCLAHFCTYKNRVLDEMEAIDDKIVWLDQNEVFRLLDEQNFNGVPFDREYNLMLSGHSLFALMAYRSWLNYAANK